MPYSYDIDTELGLVRVRRWGFLTEAEIMASYAEIADDPRFVRGFDQLTDMRDAEGCDLTSESLQDLGRLAVFERGSKRAFIASRDLHFGLLRIFQAYSDLADQQVHVCRDQDEAADWLAGAPGQTPPPVQS